MSAPPNLTNKVILLGAVNVGKTYLAHYLVHKRPLSHSHPTIAANHHEIRLPPISTLLSASRSRNNNDGFLLSLWDMPGQERYSTITPMYLRGSQLAILLCDVTEDESIYEITRFLEQLVHSSPPFKGSHYENSHFANNDYEKLSCKPIFILNKCDLATDEQIDKQERLLKKVIRETINISDIDLYIIKACCANGIGVYSPASADLDGPLPGDELSLVDVMNSILQFSPRWSINFSIIACSKNRSSIWPPKHFTI